MNKLINFLFQLFILVYSLPVDYLNFIEFSLTNPIPLKLHIGYVDLIVESHDSKKFSIEMHRSDDLNIREFIIPPLIKDFKIRMGFEIKSLGKFKIIGYYFKLTYDL